MKDCYRAAASILLLRPTEEGTMPYELLLLHKPRKNDSWQLPQGGMEEGENAEECAVRELEEEAGMTGVNVVGTSVQTYQYDFPPSYRRFRPDNICGQRISFVFAITDRSAAVTVDANEVDDYVWLPPSGLETYVRRPEYRQLVHELYEEALAQIAR